MPTPASLLSPLLLQTRQVLGFLDQGLQQAAGTSGQQPLRETRGALVRLTLLAQVQEEHQSRDLHRLIKHAQDHLQALDSEWLGRLCASEEPLLAVRSLCTELRALTGALASTPQARSTSLLFGGPVSPVDDEMLQEACDAYASHNESVGEPADYFPDAMKAAIQAALEVDARRRWAR